MTKKINPNSLLILYEGETEGEFYKLVFEKFIPPRKIKINYSNLKGVYNITKKVESKIESYLLNATFITCNHIHIFVAYDREGTREKESLLDIEYLKSEFLYKKSRIASINEIVATQDLESWFFHDLEGIYKFLKVPENQKNYKAYINVEATNNTILSALFHKFNKHYQKGKRAQGFISQLDIDKIVCNVKELNDAIQIIKSYL
ncbi:MAG: hypothetical protein A2046_02240 [Bacteroidetes bacterium GWA2_30_7]|nr:MAG: hypothetical protein A2046_02240 [Bacteroidetes bacterium GWA2_30_7]